jgi:hypothetical protein
MVICDEKTEFFFGFFMKFCLEISYDFFFVPLIRYLGGVKVEKMYIIGYFGKNTKNGLKSLFLSSIYQETAQNDEN